MSREAEALEKLVVLMQKIEKPLGEMISTWEKIASSLLVLAERELPVVTTFDFSADDLGKPFEDS